MALSDLVHWFAGGKPGYMNLVHCMNHDHLWIAITVLLDLTVALGYVLIALHWWRNERGLRDTPAKAALGTMKNIFLFCGLCGYVFIPVKMLWPAWRLYDGFLAVLAYFTWRYALNARELRVVYNELDRTEQLAEDLEASREQGRRASFFLNAVSHDLKTPLNALLLQAEVAEINMAGGDVEALRESVEQMRSCARTTAELLNHFLELGRLDWSHEPICPSEFRVADLFGQVADVARPRAAAKGVGVVVEAPADLAVRSDRLKVRRVLENLADNAVKFTNEGKVRLSAERTAAGVSLHVTDSGVGIAPEDQARVFEDFVQVHNAERDSRKGFGLGLAIARRLAHQVGGHLSVESAPGRGSRFTLHIPAASLRFEHVPDGKEPHTRPPAVARPAARPRG